MPEKTFLLGIGAQKAGTTWLYEWLLRQPGVKLGLRKELHFFDSVTLPECARNRGLNIRSALLQSAMRAAGRLVGRRKSVLEPLELIRFYFDEARYFDYYAKLLEPNGISLTGDITPTYAGLSAETFRTIRENFERRGVRVRVVFIMRDPVERCLSDARMLYAQTGLHRKHRLGEDEEAFVRRLYKNPRMELHTRYDRTICNLERAFDTDAVVIEFYERLFNVEHFGAMVKRLGLPFVGADFDRRAFASKSNAIISLDTRAAIAAHYSPVYRAMEQRFGAGLVRSLWKNGTLTSGR
jgi:hypothetical protein